MTRNVGDLDRVIRFVIGLGLFGLYFVLEGDARWWALLGLIPILTAVFGYCGAYALAGVSTASKK